MFVNPLQRARIGQGIALSQVTARTCLSARIVQLIDAGEFDQLPGGLYARSYVRTFASAVGLDPEAVIRELADRLPPEEDPFPMLRENARSDLPPVVRDLANWASQGKSFVGACASHLRVPTVHPGEHARRFAAVGVDVAVLLLFYASLLRATAWVAHLDMPTTLDNAAAPVAALTVLVGAAYFLLFGGIIGRTPGGALCGLRPSAGPSTLGLRAICVRALSMPGADAPDARSGWDGDSRHLDPADSRV